MGVSYKNEVKNKTETVSEKKQVVSILRYTLILQIKKLAYFFTSSDDALIILFFVCFIPFSVKEWGKC